MLETSLSSMMVSTLPSTQVPTLTREFASEVPLNVGVLSFVLSSVVLGPVSLAVSKSGIDGTITLNGWKPGVAGAVSVELVTDEVKSTLPTTIMPAASLPVHSTPMLTESICRPSRFSIRNCR